VIEQNYRLPKSDILKSRKAFRQLFSSGKRIKGTIGQIIYLPSDSKKIAFVVGKRVGSSVTRNTLKRRMREVYRHHKSAVPGGKMLLFQIFQQNNIPDYLAIESEFLKLCSKL
jgi:ribonuclease P protein component